MNFVLWHGKNCVLHCLLTIQTTAYVNLFLLVLFSLCVLLIQAILGGVLRGCGKQLLVAVNNVGSFYLLGLPISLTLVYAADMGALGFWIGCTVGSATQVQKFVSVIKPSSSPQLMIVSILTLRTDFKLESHKVRTLPILIFRTSVLLCTYSMHIQQESKQC